MKSVFNLLGNLSLRSRLIISSIICILLPSLASFMLANHQIKDERVLESVTQTEKSLQVLDRNITEYFDDSVYLLNYIQMDSEINSILKQNIRRSEDQSTKELNALDYIAISNNINLMTRLLKPTFVTIILENGFTFADYPYYDSTFFSQEDWSREMAKLSQLNTHWIGIHPTYIGQEIDNDYLISMTRKFPITDNSNALVIISVAEKEIHTLLKESVIETEQNLLLLDSEGTILSHSQADQVMEEFPYFEEMKGDDHHYLVVSQDQTDYLLVSSPLAYADWTLVSLVPYENVIGGIHTISNKSLVVRSIFYFLFLIILIMIVRKLTTPISTLSFVMNEVEKGNFDVRSGLTGKGDIEKLGYSLDSMLDEIERMFIRIKEEEDGKRKAELEMLQAQINPHFLFNILNSIRLKILVKGDKESAELIQSLSQLLRMTINRNNEYVTLNKEIDTTEHYIRLMNFRGSINNEIMKDLEPNILNEEVPRFFLQPIIENAIIHGYNQNGGVIRLAGWEDERYLMIQVSDQGKGMTESALEKLKEKFNNLSTNSKNRSTSSFTGIGLTNVYQRMLLIYGEKFRLEIESEPSEGTQVTFMIPR